MKVDVKYRKVTELEELPGNPRIIKKEQFEKLKTSLKSNPDYFEARPIILSDRTGKLVVIAGNQRLKAARAIGLDEVPTALIPNLTEQREKEIVIRDNVENGEWDMDILANEWDIDDLHEWGVEEAKWSKEIEEVEPDPIDEENTYSVVGKIYKLGDHRIFCGSFDDDEMMKKLFGDKKATMTFTDPPYNVGYESADGKKIQNDKMDENSFETFLNDAFRVVAEHTALGGV